jgi:hypothetical protein
MKSLIRFLDGLEKEYGNPLDVHLGIIGITIFWVLFGTAAYLLF